MSEKQKFVRGNDRIERLAQRPDLAAGVARTRREMAAADRAYARGLVALRRAAELTQVDLAKRLGVSQAAVSRMEQPHDMLVSTLRSYLEAVGGRAMVTVQFDGGREVALDLAGFARTP
jgi:DNA-binding transcriptional regulator YiaG